MINAGVKALVDFGTNDMIPHFIYCDYVDAHNFGGSAPNLRRIILKKMREYGIQSLILTKITMKRSYLITKETSKKIAEGKLKKECYPQGSINDDLYSFINNLQNSNEVEYESVPSFLHLKLTKEELKLVEEKKEEHMMTYLLELNADVDVEEMKKSNSKDKYVHCTCHRKTFHLSLSKFHFKPF